MGFRGENMKVKIQCRFFVIIADHGPHYSSGKHAFLSNSWKETVSKVEISDNDKKEKTTRPRDHLTVSYKSVFETYVCTGGRFQYNSSHRVS